MSKKRGKVCHASGPEAREVGRITEIHGVFYFRPSNATPSAPPFQGVCPRVKGGGRERFEESGQPTNDFLAKLKMHSARDANSFSRAPPRVQQSVNPPILSLSFCARTNNFQRVPLLFLPSSPSSRRNIRLRDKLREVIPFSPLLFSFLFFSLSVLFTTFRFNRRRSLFIPRLPRKGYNFKAAKRKANSPPSRARSIAGAPCLKERFGGFQRTFDPFFFAGTTNIPSITIFLEGRGIGGEQRWMVSRRFWSLSQPPAPLELDVLRVSFPPSLASLPISRSLDAKRSSRLAAGQRHGGSLPCAF